MSGTSIDVLCHPSSQGHSQCLHATADAEHRDLSVVSQPCDEKLREVALCIDVPKALTGFLTAPKRVEVGTTAKDESVDVI